MTGYGKASAEFQGKKITAEVKSLNSKALDISTRVIPAYREKEMEIRAIIAQTLERGKVEFNLWTEQTDNVAEIPVNGPLAEVCYRQLKELSNQYGIPEPADWWSILLRMPDVMNRSESREMAEGEWPVVRSVVEQAVNQLMEFRRQEGAALER